MNVNIPQIQEQIKNKTPIVEELELNWNLPKIKEKIGQYSEDKETLLLQICDILDYLNKKIPVSKEIRTVISSIIQKSDVRFVSIVESRLMFVIETDQ